jgi:pimeloyl-ACP methyl ester carboxylesterase
MTATLVLRDGRSLDLHDSGSGPVVVYHHGTPSSGSVPPALLDAAASLGVRVVSWSRPGYADSTRQAGRRVADVASDAVEVLDALGVERAASIGWSGGGPHALACGALAPARFPSVGLLAGVAPYAESRGTLDWLEGMGQENLDEFGAAFEGEAAVRGYLEPGLDGMRAITAETLVEGMESLLPEVDRTAIRAGMGEWLADTFRAAVGEGVDGWVDDDLAFVEPWGFDLAAVEVPVDVWQGSADLMVPGPHGAWLARALPTATVHLLDGAGHLSLVADHAAEVLERAVAPLA